ncbi:Monogalactosyldiacylglycerol synthase 1 [Forsythia ovata]|uniref:Monogalactosyldiacylglycerol synthase 1 n=1 Tax=Forsythia ovata TaxID=205694 RepID=A0ABD1VJ69_9LAMI
MLGVSGSGKFLATSRLSSADGSTMGISSIFFISSVEESSTNGGSDFYAEKKPKVVASLSLSTKDSAYRFKSVLNQFNRAIKFHYGRILLSIFDDQVNSEENNGFRNDGHGFLEDSEGVPVNGDSESSKKVLILMSNTDGGHRASSRPLRLLYGKSMMFNNDKIPRKMMKKEKATKLEDLYFSVYINVG